MGRVLIDELHVLNLLVAFIQIFLINANLVDSDNSRLIKAKVVESDVEAFRHYQHLARCKERAGFC
jgi:hypothetical protein